MIKRFIAILLMAAIAFSLFSCGKDSTMQFTGAQGEVKIMTLDPGHFHAALVQKTMYDQVSPVVHVYAPDGADVVDHLKRIDGFNTRADNPTSWEEVIYKGDDFLEKMLQEKPGNVMITAGRNRLKTQYIKAAIDAGINVLADKPMCITPENFKVLESAFESAQENNVLLYDIMTERHEITTTLQKMLSLKPAVFGELIEGSVDKPAVTKESVHHFFKYVAGNPLKRSAWYFDTTQQGEGIVDVATHLVDLIQWECFPEQIIEYSDIEMIEAKRFPTVVTPEQFEKVTQIKAFPDFLQKYVVNGNLHCYANGEFTYKLRGKYAKVSVIWNYQAPEGAKDTHYSIMRGSKADVVIRQGAEQNYKPELYVENIQDAVALKTAIAEIASDYPGIELEQTGDIFHVSIPEKYHVGHEAHFGQVTEKYLQYLIDGNLPEWEVPNMLAKYYTNMQALQLALQ